MTLLSLAAVGQETRSEISVQGTGFFTKDSNGNNIRNQADNTGGILVGYRYHISRWLAAEADYGWSRNPQTFLGSLPASVQADVHQITGAAVVNLPGFAIKLPRVSTERDLGGKARKQVAPPEAEISSAEHLVAWAIDAARDAAQLSVFSQGPTIATVLETK